MNRMRCNILLSLFIVVLLSIGTAFGQEANKASSGQEKGGDDLRKKAQNPIASMYSLPIKTTVDFGAPNGEALFVNLQPVLPLSVGNWNLVSRFIVPAIVSVDGYIEGTPEIPSGSPGDERKTGLGDINYSLFFSPADSSGPIWGIGPAISMPTASDDQLGSGKWSAGPTAVALWQPKWGTFGSLVAQIWSFEGDGDRADVSQFLIEPFASYNLANGWYLVTDMIMTANWKGASGKKWTVPVGGGLGKLFAIGNQPINANLQSYYMVERPDGAPKWNIVCTFSFLFPKK